MVSTRLLSVFASLAVVVRGANHDVNVGQSGLTFSPTNIPNVAQQDTVTFHFDATHTASESSLTDPCTLKTGGFNSGQMSSGTYQITINSTDPVWVFCNIPGHCRSGMVFAVNPGANFAAFQATAQGQTVPGNSTSSTSSTATGGGSSSSGSSSSTRASTSSTAAGSGGGGYGSPGAAGRSMEMGAFWVVAAAVLYVASL